MTNRTNILVTPEVFTSLFGPGKREIVAVELTRLADGYPVLLFTVEGDVPATPFSEVIFSHDLARNACSFTLKPRIV